MAEKTEHRKIFDTCLEDSTCAAMMHTVLGQTGIGSLCADMLKKMGEPHAKGDRCPCAEMLRSVMKETGDRKAEPTPKEDGHGGDK